MFMKLCSTLALVSAALALSVTAPSGVTSGGQTTITWSSTSSDPVFSIELHHPSFNNDFAIANNVNVSANSLAIAMPQVPAQDGYTLNFVNVTNINQVFASSGSFAIGAPTSASSGGASQTPSGSAGTGAGSGASASASATGSGASANPSTTAPSGSASGSGSGSGSGSASASAPSSSTSNTPSSASRTAPAVGAALFAIAAAAWVL